LQFYGFAIEILGRAIKILLVWAAVRWVTQAMNDKDHLQTPATFDRILSETTAAGFSMASEPLTGSLLKTLAASKRSGYFLELGTGTGLATAWLLDGMDDESKLVTVDNDSRVAAIAQKHLGQDQRVSFCIEDAGNVIPRFTEQKQGFDLIFADAWVGKYTLLDETLSLLRPGDFYVIDDMLPQTTWLEGHGFKVASLIKTLSNRSDLLITKLNWASGIIIATKL
jgi:predicted O-methyltransferase YrrM